MRLSAKKISAVIIAILLIFLIVFFFFYAKRIQSIQSIQKITDYDDGFNLYTMDIQYDYDLDRMLDGRITDDQSFIDTVLEEALPFIPVHMEAPNFGCSAFTLQTPTDDVLMGRNYDFRNNTSAMLVYCSPKNGYKSVACAALDNISANNADNSIKTQLACLTAPFICLDGMNEKGVSIAVLTLDSEPTRQNTGKPTICTTLAIRLVLDHAATTEEAVELLNQYDMFATSGRDYHFYITDASGDGRIIEYDCESEARDLVATPTRTTTNFFLMYKDKVTKYGKNGIYGHGKDRYDAIEAVFNASDCAFDRNAGWEALKAAAQEPNTESITSNTQWSILFNDTTLQAEIVIRRHWDDIFTYDLGTDTLSR